MLIFINLTWQSVNAQHVSRNNYSGAWEAPSSWNPEWPAPLKTIQGYDITINGYITSNSSLNFTGSANNLIVNDTLLILGDLTVNNNNQIIINDNGILIIRGNFIMENQSSVTANGYFIISGNYTKTSAIGQGSFNTNDAPSKIFIGGSVTPAAITNNRSNYPALNCSSPVAPYTNSSCTYGNMTDFSNDPLYSFFGSTCGEASANANGPLCSGSTVLLTASGGTNYSWTGPAGFTSTLRNPVILNSTVINSGSYTVNVTSSGCAATSSSVTVTINEMPALNITDPLSVCSPATINLTDPLITAGSTSGISLTYWTDEAATIVYPTPATAGNGIYFIKGTINSTGCYTVKPVTATVNSSPVLVITNPAAVCFPSTVDLTTPAVTYGSTPGIILSYYIDAGATKEYTTPANAVNGNYYIKGSGTNGCYDIRQVTATVNPLPDLEITSSKQPMCIDEKRSLTAIPQGGVFEIISGPGAISGTTLTATGDGNILFKYIYTGNCTNSLSQTIVVYPEPYAEAGPDQVLEYTFETSMTAELAALQKGEWSLDSGSGKVESINSPTSAVKELALGENIFNWTVTSGTCIASDKVKITVNDLLIPTVITPNGDGKNDYFRINYQGEHTELTVYNRWGKIEYSNNNYKNEWDGKNNQGDDLAEDTYYVVIRFGNGMTRKGSLMIIR